MHVLEAERGSKTYVSTYIVKSDFFERLRVHDPHEMHYVDKVAQSTPFNFREKIWQGTGGASLMAAEALSAYQSSRSFPSKMLDLELTLMGLPLVLMGLRLPPTNDITEFSLVFRAPIYEGNKLRIEAHPNSNLSLEMKLINVSEDKLAIEGSMVVGTRSKNGNDKSKYVERHYGPDKNGDKNNQLNLGGYKERTRSLGDELELSVGDYFLIDTTPPTDSKSAQVPPQLGEGMRSLSSLLLVSGVIGKYFPGALYVSQDGKIYAHRNGGDSRQKGDITTVEIVVTKETTSRTFAPYKFYDIVTNAWDTTKPNEAIPKIFGGKATILFSHEKQKEIRELMAKNGSK